MDLNHDTFGYLVSFLDVTSTIMLSETCKLANKMCKGINIPTKKLMLVEYVAIENHVDIFQELYESGDYVIDTNLAIMNAALGGSIDILEFLRENDVVITHYAYSGAFLSFNLKSLEYLKLTHVMWHPSSSITPARVGRLDSLKWIIESNLDIDYRSLSSAIDNGHFECAKYLSQYCQSVPSLNVAVQKGYADIVSFFLSKYNYIHRSDLTLAAVNNDRLDILRLLMNAGVRHHRDLCEVAAKKGNFEMLLYMISIGCFYEVHVLLKKCVRRDHADILAYCHTVLGEELQCHLLVIALVRGSVKCIRYLVENGCELPSHIKELRFMSDKELVISYK